ncbi:MAG TPA: type IV pilus twitching motility protein PilT [Thermoanaerobaculia bacterium]|nr:type IV pilus twitching motility protein PilT [Thermoanaerobaculia bacterium]
MASGQEELLFGRLALHYKLITAGQLDEVHGLHSLAGGRRPLPEMLVEMGYLTQRQVEQLLLVQRDYLQKRRDAQAVAPATAAATAPGDGAAAAVSAAPGAAAAAAPPAATEGAAAGAATAADEAEPAAAPPWLDGAAGRRQLDALLQVAVERGASDIHLHSGAPVGVRLIGRLEDLHPQPLPPAAAARMIEEALDDNQRALLASRGQVDFAYSLPGRARFRANAYRQQRGVDAVFRTIPSDPPTLHSLGLPESLARLADLHQGMVLITGPGGCGKSATMAALLSIINQTRADHIVTIEDPIEYIHPSRRAIVNQRQVGPHTASFARALRAALREDPDVVAIGELRDLETISLAITDAETGHLVLGTLHTNNAVRTINRMLGVFPPNQQSQMRAMISESLRAVVSQRLVARADGRGRVPAIEVLIVTKAAANLIRESKTFQIRSILQTGAAQGMVQLDNSLAELVRSGVVTREEALLQAEDPTRIP